MFLFEKFPGEQMSLRMSPNRQLVYNKTEFCLTESLLSLIWIKLVPGTLPPKGLAEAKYL